MRRDASESEREDKALMNKLSLGDLSALDKLYRKHRQGIEAFVRYKLSGGNLSDLDIGDIVQEIFRRVQQKAKMYRPTGKALSWMRKIAQNIIIDIVRQQLSKARRETNYALAHPPQGGEVEGPGTPMWEYGDPVTGQGGLCGADLPVHSDYEELYGVAGSCKFVIIPREGGGDNLVWIGPFPARRTRSGKGDRIGIWMRGGGPDTIPGMFSRLGLAPREQ